MIAGDPIQLEAPGHAGPAWFDVTRDGHPDLVVGQNQGGAVLIYAAKRKGGLSKARPLKVKGKPLKIPGISDMPAAFGATPHFADVDGDGRTDLLSGS